MKGRSGTYRCLLCGPWTRGISCNQRSPCNRSETCVNVYGGTVQMTRVRSTLFQVQIDIHQPGGESKALLVLV